MCCYLDRSPQTSHVLKMWSNRLVLLGRGGLLGHDLEGCCGTRGVDLELLPSALAMTHCHMDVYSSRPPGSRPEPPKPSTNSGIAL